MYNFKKLFLIQIIIIELNGFKYCNLTLKILFNYDHLLAQLYSFTYSYTIIFREFYLIHWGQPSRVND